MDNQINIQKENVLNAYKNGNQDLKALLEELFGKDIFQPKDIKERVKTFEDAYNTLGEEHPLVKEYLDLVMYTKQDLTAYLKLRIICAALNEGWEPTFDSDECRFYPRFDLYTQKEYDELVEGKRKSCCVPLRSVNYALACGSFVYAYANYDGTYADAYVGMRLAFKTKELAEYCGKQFIDIWAEFLF